METCLISIVKKMDQEQGVTSILYIKQVYCIVT